MYAHDASDGRRDLPFSCLQHLVEDATRKALDAFLCGQIFQELNVLLFIYFFFAHVIRKLLHQSKSLNLKRLLLPSRNRRCDDYHD